MRNGYSQPPSRTPDHDPGLPATTGRARFTGWRPRGFDRVLADAGQVKNLPGRPSVIRLTRGGWPCFERGAVTSCFVATPEFRLIRLHTRYRQDLTEEPTRKSSARKSCWNRPRSSCIRRHRPARGVTGRDIMDHLIAGARNPKVLAQLARTAAAARSASWKRRWKARSSSPKTTPPCSPRCWPASTGSTSASTSSPP